MCEIHVFPTCKVADISRMAQHMGLRPVRSTDGRLVLLTPNHERIQTLRAKPRIAKDGKVLSTWSSPFVDDNDPEPPAAA